MSELTEEQYLDAISCPRIKPTKEAKYVMGGGESSSENAEDDSSEEELNLEDTEDEEEEDTEKLPPGVIRPEDRQQMVKIEVLCRIICSKPPNQHGAVESHLKKKLQGRADHKFLSPHNQHHRYYVWRLAENRAGRGYAPEDDLPGLAPGVLR